MNRKIALSLAVIPVAMLVVVSFSVMQAHAVRLRSLDHLKVGDSFAEVETRLGPANWVMQGPYGTQWRYEGWTWCYVVISFDENGQVTEIVHDH